MVSIWPSQLDSKHPWENWRRNCRSNLGQTHHWWLLRQENERKCIKNAFCLHILLLHSILPSNVYSRIFICDHLQRSLYAHEFVLGQIWGRANENLRTCILWQLHELGWYGWICHLLHILWSKNHWPRNDNAKLQIGPYRGCPYFLEFPTDSVHSP